MSMIRDAIEKILALSTVQQLEIDGREYTDKKLVPVLRPEPVVLALQTLTGVKDYLNENPDGLELDTVLIHVTGPTEVKVFSRLSGPFEQRMPYLRAMHEMPSFRFDTYMDIETFIVELQAKFVQDEMTAAILQLMGNITEGLIRTYADDGITQEVTAKNGVGRVEGRPVPNPVVLSPFRTFNEITQPPGRFVFRLRPGREERPQAALFQADGGAWQLTAIEFIRQWLRSYVPEEVVVIA
jgi:hypothetical protein